jgi:hypothetical protein
MDLQKTLIENNTKYFLVYYNRGERAEWLLDTLLEHKVVDAKNIYDREETIESWHYCFSHRGWKELATKEKEIKSQDILGGTETVLFFTEQDLQFLIPTGESKL